MWLYSEGVRTPSLPARRARLSASGPSASTRSAAARDAVAVVRPGLCAMLVFPAHALQKVHDDRCGLLWQLGMWVMPGAFDDGHLHARRAAQPLGNGARLAGGIGEVRVLGADHDQRGRPHVAEGWPDGRLAP